MYEFLGPVLVSNFFSLPWFPWKTYVFHRRTSEFYHPIRLLSWTELTFWYVFAYFVHSIIISIETETETGLYQSNLDVWPFVIFVTKMWPNLFYWKNYNKKKSVRQRSQIQNSAIFRWTRPSVSWIFAPKTFCVTILTTLIQRLCGSLRP